MSPFSIVPIEAFTDKRLTLEQLRILGVLYSFKNKDSDTVFPSRDAIAKRCGMHKANISMATSALEKLGWVSKEGKGGYSRATRYTLHIPETVAHSTTVADQTTVAHSATGGVADQATRLPVAEWATRKEQTSKQTKVTKSGVANKATRLTVDWFAPDEWIEWAVQERSLSQSQVQLIAKRFKTYWLSADAKHPAKKDWSAAWKKWVLGENVPGAPQLLPAGNLAGMNYAKGLG